jgi:excisionase family DNA binding protein
MAQEGKLLTTGEVGQKLSVSDETVRRWCAEGTIPAILLPSGRWRVRPAVVESILSGTDMSANAA